MLSLKEFVDTALKESDPSNIPDFAYWGDLELGKEWIYTFSHHRDSSLVDESNWDVLVKEAEKLFPDDYQIERSSHWAVGWVEQMCVRVYDEKGEYTKALLWAYETWLALQDYPILDEMAYSEMEYNESLEALEWSAPSNTIDDLPDDYLSQVFSWLWDNNIYYEEGWYDKEVKEAFQALGFLEEED